MSFIVEGRESGSTFAVDRMSLLQKMTGDCEYSRSLLRIGECYNRDKHTVQCRPTSVVLADSRDFYISSSTDVNIMTCQHS